MPKGIHFRPTEKAQQTIDYIVKEHPKFNQTQAINYALEAFQSEPQPKLVYDPSEPECEFGTLLREEKKIHCKCTYPSIKKWLPRNRKVDPEVCKQCYPRIQRIQDWIAERKEKSMPTRPESLAEPALCTLKQEWFRDYADFPCWQDTNFKCPNVKCEIQPRR